MSKKSVSLADEFYIKPQPGYLICKPLKEKNVGNISISDNMSDKDSAGIVVAVGDSFDDFKDADGATIKSPVKVGDKIIFSNYSNQRYLDFKTGEHVYFIKYHINPLLNQVMGIINE